MRLHGVVSTQPPSTASTPDTADLPESGGGVYDIQLVYLTTEFEEGSPLRTGLLRRAALNTALVGALVVTFTAGVGQARPGPVAENAPAGLERFYFQQLAWKPCGDKNLDKAGAQCADVTVPLDYSNPNGRTIVLAISRLKATDTAGRHGIMLTNAGGPGAAGLDFPVLGRKAMSPGVRARFDLIGMDPRGIGRSAPVQCGWFLPTMLRSAGSDLAGFSGDVALEALMAGQCLAADPEKLRFITTRNTARDMDVVRAVLGEPRISYFGISYGSYLGAVFTQMFPQRSDRFVLDSALDPDRYWAGTVQDMGAANEAALDDWASWVAARDATYRLGATAAQVRAVVQDLIRRAAARPIRVGALPLDHHLLPMVVFQLLSDPRLNGVLADLVRLMVDTADGRPGQLPQRDRAPLQKATAQDGSAMAAVVCGDVAVPRDPAWYWRNIERSRAAQPIFGAFANNIEACAFWPDPVERPTVVRNAVPALILQATGDPRTAYREGVALHRDMTGSRLITLQDYRIHVTFRVGLSRCLNEAVNRYLLDGALPHTDLTCRADSKWAEREVELSDN